MKGVGREPLRARLSATIPTLDPPPSTLPLRPSMPCETPVPQTRHRNFDPAPSTPGANQTTTVDFEDSSPGHPGTPAPPLWHPHSSATLRPATPAPGRTNPEALHIGACPAPPRPRAASPPRQRYLSWPRPPARPERSPQSLECPWSCC